MIGSLDGDLSFDGEYSSFLLEKLNENPALGLVGTPFQDGPNKTYDYRFVSIEYVSGACQLFRRQCFEDIGGYKPVKGGHRPHRGTHGQNERMENPNLHRENVFASSADGNCGAWYV